MFYAWQSDRPNNLCRSFIRRALDEAKKQLEGDLDIQDAVRGEVVVDQDTQDVPGSPPITETIFRKIRECNAFIADLTPTFTGQNKRIAPNPNVLIEYGYALHALGDQRIIGVFNEAFGKPDELPFDLRHRRWPIRYRAHEDDTEEARREERQRLARELARAIRSIIKTLAESRSSGLTGAASTAVDTPAAFPVTAHQAAYAHLAARGVTDQFPWDEPLVQLDSGTRIGLREAPTIFLNLRSHKAGRQLDNASVQRIARASLRPLADNRSDGRSLARSRHGAVVYASSGTSPPVALTASILARDGSLSGIDRFHLRMNGSEQRTDPYVPTVAVEEILMDGLANFMSVAEHQLNLELPLDVAVGLEGVEGFMLAISRPLYFQELAGPILVKLSPARRSGSVAGVTGACVCDASGLNWLRVG